MNDAFSATFESIIQDTYGQVVACLLCDGLDLVQAEDAVALAIERAWRFWPVYTVPESPKAWLLTVARRVARDELRRRHREQQASYAPEPWSVPALPEEIPDERLRLCFLCAHPTIEPHEQTALMLQCVIGLTAERLAGLYCLPAPAMSQRLVRAKRKLVALGASRFHDSLMSEPQRLGAVMEALYAAYGLAWEAPGQPEQRSWAQELMSLAQALAELMPNEPEPRGLLALMLFAESRRIARRGSGGQFVPLDAQDPTQWDPGLWNRAEHALHMASQAGRPGRYQLEAAIQSAHMQRISVGAPELSTILKLYDALAAHHPTWGIQLGRIALLARVEGPVQALNELEGLGDVPDFQPYWAVRAELLHQCNRPEEARAASARAATLVEDSAVRDFLLQD